jgi:hypothetical protein
MLKQDILFCPLVSIFVTIGEALPDLYLCDNCQSMPIYKGNGIPFAGDTNIIAEFARKEILLTRAWDGNLFVSVHNLCRL